MPISKDVGKNIMTLRGLHPDWSEDKIKAVALEEARRAGNRKVKNKPSSITRKRGGR